MTHMSFPFLLHALYTLPYFLALISWSDIRPCLSILFLPPTSTFMRQLLVLVLCLTYTTRIITEYIPFLLPTLYSLYHFLVLFCCLTYIPCLISSRCLTARRGLSYFDDVALFD